MFSTTNNSQNKNPLKVKLRKSLSRTRKSSIPAVKFEKQDLSSYSGLVVVQKLFQDLNFKEGFRRLSGTFSGHYSYCQLFRLLIVNALLGMRKLRDIDLYREDPIVKRTLGMSNLPSVSKVSRMLEQCGEQ